MKVTQYNLNGCSEIKFLSHLYMVEISASFEDFLSLIFKGFVCFFSPVGSMQSFIVIVSWFVLIVMLGHFCALEQKDQKQTNMFLNSDSR